MLALGLQFLCFNQSLSQDASLNLEPYTFKTRGGDSLQAELGKFQVLENRNVNDGKTITLSFVRFKSTNPNPGHPIVYLAGGPGGSGINAAKGARFKLFMALRSVADVIAFDQRGTGMSNQIPACSATAQFPLDQPGTLEAYASGMASAAKECLEYWKSEGIDIAAYNTEENANDLEDLRKVLGAKKISLWGISYGSHLAFNFIKRYGKSIDKVVLAGLEGPDHTIKLPAYNQNYLKRLNAQVQLDSEARAYYPDLLELMEEVLTGLKSKPVTATTVDPRSGTSFEVGISALDAQLVTSYFLTKNPSNATRLPLIYHNMKNGNYSEMAQMVGILKTYAGQIQGMPLAMDAMSGVSEDRWQEIQEQSDKALLGRTTNFPFPDVSKDLGLPDLGEDFRSNPTSKTPVLFLSGTLDGRTYIESAEELARGFRNCTHIIINGAGHDLFMSSPKVTDLITAFLSGDKVEQQEIKIEVPNFAVPN